MIAPTVVIMAAGQGTRMRSRTPKVLHDVCGRPMVHWPALAALEAGAGKVVVVGGPDRALEGHLPDGVVLAVQHEPKGTADAVLSAAEHFTDAPVIVLSGDVPLITAQEIAELARVHQETGAAATMVTMLLDDPGQYGRVVRNGDGDVVKVVEAKAPGDATDEELAIREVNTGVYAFAGAGLRDALEAITPDNAQGELYLPDALPILRHRGGRVAAHVVDDPALTLGVNDRVDLAAVRAVAQQRIVEAHQRNGVTVVNPATTLIDAGVQIGQDTVVEPSTFLRGATRIGAGCRIGPLTTAIDARLGDGAEAVHSYLVDCDVEEDVSIGPFAYLRPGTRMRAGSKAGTFVEIKNSDIGEGAKVPHLSYVGDADVGPGSNLGAATITANYDGKRKHRTTVGAKVRTSVDTTLVAPVTIGDGAYTGAGSVITKDIPPGALGIARGHQTNIEGYAERKEAQS